MKKIFAYLLIAVGLGGFLFFWTYNGSTIPVRELWFVLSLLIAAAGFFIMAKTNFDRFVATEHIRLVVPREELRKTGIKVKITLDNCEVKSRSYQQEVISDPYPTDIEMLDAIANPEKNFKTANIQQTYVVYEGLFRGVPYKFISYPTSMDEISVRMLIDSHGGMLYVDKTNPSQYFFDLPF